MIDPYWTPEDLSLALVQALPIRDGDMIMEPSVGGGSWVRAVAQAFPRTHRVGLDLDPQAPGLALGPELLNEGLVGDFTKWKPKAWTARPHWIIGNPPYTAGQDLAHVHHALRVVRARGSVAMLLPLAFLAGGERWNTLHWKLRPRLIVFIPFRPKFQGPANKGLAGKRDNVFIWWDLGWSGPTLTAWVDPATMTVVGDARAPAQGASHG